MTFIRRFFITVSLIAGIGCAIFGSMEIREYKTVGVPTSNSSYLTDRITTHLGLDGGAIGLGIISGMSLLALGITYIGKEEK